MAFSSAPWQYHKDAEEAFFRIRFAGPAPETEDLELVRGLFDLTRPDSPAKMQGLAALSPLPRAPHTESLKGQSL